MNLQIADAVARYVEDALELPFKIYADIIPETAEPAACLRHDPSPAAIKRFNDGSKLVRWNLTFYARSRDAQAALSYAKNFMDILDAVFIDVEADGNAERIYCEAQTLPQFIEFDAKGCAVYSASATCEYLEQGET